MIKSITLYTGVGIICLVLGYIGGSLAIPLKPYFCTKDMCYDSDGEEHYQGDV